jgi:hypothetical protein
MRTVDQLASLIIELLDGRAVHATICPSEVARAADSDGWRDLMDPVRQAASRLVEQREVVITQGGEVVDPASARGPIRIRRATT